MKQEFKVGIISIIGIAVLVFFTIWIGRMTIGGSQQEYILKFDFVDAVKVGTAVKVAGGVQVGEVSELKLDPDGQSALVYITITSDNIVITDQTEFMIFSESLLGGKYVHIQGMGVGEKLPEGTIIRGKDPSNLGIVMSKVGDAIDGIMESDAADSTLGNVGTLINNANLFITNLNTLITENGPQINSILTHLAVVSEDINRIVMKIEPLIDNGAELIDTGNTFVKKDLHHTLQEVNRLIRKADNELTLLANQGKGALTEVQEGVYNLLEGTDGFSGISRRANRMLDNSEEDIGQALQNVKTTIRRVDYLVAQFNQLTESISDDYANNNSTIGMLARDQQVAADLQAIVSNLKTITEEIRSSFLFETPNASEAIGPYNQRRSND